MLHSDTAFSRTMLTMRSLCLLISLYSLSQFSTAAKQNMQTLKESTKTYVLSQIPHTEEEAIEISLSGLDRRIKLAACTQPLNFKRRNTSNNAYKMRVEVSCNGNKSWKINFTAKIHIYEPVVVLKVRKFRNEVIEASDLDIVTKDVSQFQHAYFQNIKDLAGYKLKTSINKGIVVSPSQVVQPWLVKKNQPITISAASSVLNIRMAGRSLMNARAGDWVRAKNINSGKIVEGTLNKRGELLVGF